MFLSVVAVSDASNETEVCPGVLLTYGPIRLRCHCHGRILDLIVSVLEIEHPAHRSVSVSGHSLFEVRLRSSGLASECWSMLRTGPAWSRP